MSLLGIDIGTSGCKAAAFSTAGRCLVSAYREYDTQHPRSDWAELDSLLVWQKTREVIAEVAAATGGDPITALCTSSMGEAMAPVSRDRRILGNCILGSDLRGGEYIDRLRAGLGQEAFYRINANILGVNYSLPKLLWLRDNDRPLYNRADLFLLWGDLVGYLLGCEPCTSYSLANRTLLFDIQRQGWSPELLALSGMDGGKLAHPVASGSIAGTVSDAAASELGLPRGVAVVVGGHDQACNALGAGIYRPGGAVCGIGTFECITPAYDHIPDPAVMLEGGLNVEHHVVPGLYVSFIYNQGGSLVRWFRDCFAAGEPRDGGLYARLAAEMPPGPTRLLTLPYFEMTGPPHFVSDAAGAIIGLKTSTTRGEILKSIMECQTFYFVDSMQTLGRMGIDASEFIATGGGAKSDAWLQIKADIFGVPFMRPRISEGGLAGAAILAGVATGALPSLAEAVGRFVHRDRTFTPDPRRHAEYQAILLKYRQLLPALHGLFKQLG